MGYDLSSPDFELHRETSQSWCQERCNSVAGCAAYTVGNASWGCVNCCWLKSALEPLIKRSGRMTVYMPLTRKYNPSPGTTLTGEDIDFFRDTTQAWCQAKCDTVAACQAFVSGTLDIGDCVNCCWLKHTVTGKPQGSPGTTSYLRASSVPSPFGEYAQLSYGMLRAKVPA